MAYVAFGESLCEYERWENRQERSRCIQLAYMRSNTHWPMWVSDKYILSTHVSRSLQDIITSDIITKQIPLNLLGII